VKVVGGGSFEVAIAVRKNIEMFKPENLTIFEPSYMGSLC
jgi:hypothetical protein